MTLYFVTLLGVSLVVGYGLGSVPFGLVLTRLAGGGDIRKIGSGNIGATNVLRTGRKGLAAATLLLDGLKGTLALYAGPFVAALIAGKLPPAETALSSSVQASPALIGMLASAALVAGVGAFLGHLYPVWLRFKGGKGVATYLGVLAGLDWKMGLVFAVVWLTLAALARYSSLAALSASAVVAAILALREIGPLSITFIVLTALLFWTHRANIKRLLNRTETTIGAKA
jgi:glycerol-3-phosphate acyltransferase PlsY